MSWQDYIDTNLLGTGVVHKAAIIGHDGNTWAVSAGFSISPEEGKKLVNGLGSPNLFFSEGVRIGGVKFMCLRAEDSKVYARKESEGVCVVKTEKAVLIGMYDCSSVQPGQANVVIERLAEYFISVGY
eukprot:Sdes_comp22248_c0_seq1m20743